MDNDTRLYFNFAIVCIFEYLADVGNFTNKRNLHNYYPDTI